MLFKAKAAKHTPYSFSCFRTFVVILLLFVVEGAGPKFEIDNAESVHINFRHSFSNDEGCGATQKLDFL